jgi:hypothetical protein
MRLPESDCRSLGGTGGWPARVRREHGRASRPCHPEGNSREPYHSVRRNESRNAVASFAVAYSVVPITITW